MNEYTCHSGGCPGSDITWERECDKYEIYTIAYSFYNHKHDSNNPKVLTVEELNEGWQAVLAAEKTLKRNVGRVIYPYVKNLLCRNWFQVKNSDAVFAIGKFVNRKIVSGGTGWAVQMAIDNKKDVFLFDQKENVWNKFNYETMEFNEIDYIPTLTKNFAGVGTREINGHGINAIKKILEFNFKSNSY